MAHSYGQLRPSGSGQREVPGLGFSPACGELVALGGYVGAWWSTSNRFEETVQARMQSHESDAPTASPVVRGTVMSDEGERAWTQAVAFTRDRSPASFD